MPALRRPAGGDVPPDVCRRRCTFRASGYRAFRVGVVQRGGHVAVRKTESQCGRPMTSEPGMTSDTGQGMQALMLAHRPALLRFLASHGTADEVEDLFQELWLRIAHTPSGPVASPLAYIYRAANNLAIDRHRTRRQAQAREQAWTETLHDTAEPGTERQIISRQELASIQSVLESLGERVSQVVRRFRLDGVPQRQIAAELGVSLSTVESDLRRAYVALVDARRQSDDA